MPSPLPSPAEVQALIDRAKSEGRHSDTFQTVRVRRCGWFRSVGCGCAACEAVRSARMARLCPRSAGKGGEGA
jgi:hypothetical protein